MLKKIVLTLAMVAFAANVFAATAATIVTPVAIKFVPSKNVTLGYEASAGSAAAAGTTSNSVYAIASKNTAGDKCFATTSSSSAIVWRDAGAGAALTIDSIPDLPSSPTDSTITGGGTGWLVL